MFPAAGAGGGVREQEGAQRATGKAQADGDAVLDGKAAGGAGGLGLHGNDLAAQRTQVADLVDQVDQHRSAPGFAAPGRGVEVIIGLVEQGAAHHRHEVAEDALGDDLAGLVENRAVGAMVAHQQSCAALLGDGVWDALSWLGLGIPAALALRGLLQRR
ncbi:hypothetical protein D9M71_561950 [compost metagenome]